MMPITWKPIDSLPEGFPYRDGCEDTFLVSDGHSVAIVSLGFIDGEFRDELSYECERSGHQTIDFSPLYWMEIPDPPTHDGAA